MTDIEQQFAGNYVRLVNQCRDLQADITIKDKMIELMAKYWLLEYPNHETEQNIIDEYKKEAIEQLIAEQNKKAADNASI